MADGLAVGGVTTVAMDSTGMSWSPVYDSVEARGLAGHWITARPRPHVPGCKTDVLDGPWIPQLPPDGLWRGSVRPDDDRCARRASIRPRDPRLRDRAAPVPPMPHALPLMPGPWTNVSSDIPGVTGLQILHASSHGAREPPTLAASRHAPWAKREADMANACTGHYRPEPLVALQHALAWSDFDQQPITAGDLELEPRSAAFTPPVNRLETP